MPFVFKQWGGTRKHETGRTLDGRTYDEFPFAFHGVLARGEAPGLILDLPSPRGNGITGWLRQLDDCN